MEKNCMCQNPVGKGKSNLLRRLKADWKRRNWVTDVILYGVQIASVLYGLFLLTGILLNTWCNFFYFPETSTLRKPLMEFLWHEFYKGFIPGLLICVLALICNNRIIRWKADGLLWLFIFLFVVCFGTIFSEAEEFLCFSGFSLLSFLFYAASLWLPKNVDGSNTNTFRQCAKPSNWLVTSSYIVVFLWILFTFDAIVML